MPRRARILALLFLSAALPARAQEMVDEAVYFTEHERILRAFDINDSDNILSLMGDLEGSSMIIKVKDADERAIGIFKPTSGNTSHISELVAYRLCRRLDLPVCLPTVKKTLDHVTLFHFSEMLERKSFAAPEDSRHENHYTLKEQYRQAMVDRLNDYAALDGAFKTWMSPLVLYEGLGRIESVLEHPIYTYMRHDGPIADQEVFELSQCTQIYQPAGCYRAQITYKHLIEQFTGILIVDALIGNSDRFAGGNVHLFSLEERYIEEGDGRYLLPSASLLMLDNGSGFMRFPTSGMTFLTKDLKITRFYRMHYDALVQLAKDFKADRAGTMDELGLVKRFEHAGNTSRPDKAFEKNLRGLIRYMRDLEKRHGRDVWY